MRYDFLTKNLIRTFDWNDLGCDRSISEEVCINGRKYLKTGVATSTTVVGNLYLVYDRSVKQNKSFLISFLIPLTSSICESSKTDCALSVTGP